MTENKWMRAGSILLAVALSVALLFGCGAKDAVNSVDAQDAAGVAASGSALPVTIQPGMGALAVEVADAADTVTVSATHTVYLVPDKAEVNLGVRTRNASVTQAQQQNSETVNAVIEAVKALGVDEKSIRTGNYSIYQDYNYNTNTVSAHVVSTSLTVKDLDIELAGEVLQKAVEAGANEANGIRFTCSGYDEAYDEALAGAVEDARAKAETLAEASGKTLGEVHSLTEGYQNTYAKYSSSNIAVEEATADSADMRVMMPGESEIAAQVTVTFEME